MAHVAYLKIEGKTQGLISSGCNSPGSIGDRYQSKHIDEISVIAAEHSQLKLVNHTRTQFNPFVITKWVDKSSPLLGTAFSRQEKLQCELSFYRTNDKGYNEKYYTVTLVDALITSHTFSLPHVIDFGKNDMHEVIGLSYKEIIWKHLVAGTEGYGLWDRV